MEKKDRILFVIPAYNESENIKKVLEEIKKDAKDADILVINDCSKDNTRDIVLEENVDCIDNVFNMGYAMAVQTGLKYAYNHDYDYVIQFDGDGQHIASEAIKLYETAKKDKADVVIGSRYLKDMGYPVNKLRRAGTKMFENVIRRYCGVTIADPLSGFQCLNKRVIEKYSKMGGYPEFPDANLVIEMLLQGYKIVEVPVKMRARTAGVSMHSGLWKNIKYMVGMFYTIFFVLLQNPKRKGN